VHLVGFYDDDDDDDDNNNNNNNNSVSETTLRLLSLQSQFKLLDKPLAMKWWQKCGW